MLSFTNEILFIGFEKKKKSISIFVLWKKAQMQCFEKKKKYFYLCFMEKKKVFRSMNYIYRGNECLKLR